MKKLRRQNVLGIGFLILAVSAALFLLSYPTYMSGASAYWQETNVTEITYQIMLLDERIVFPTVSYLAAIGIVLIIAGFIIPNSSEQ